MTLRSWSFFSFGRAFPYLRLHAWVMTDQVDARGYYVLDKHAVVTFFFESVTGLELSGFSGQNVINGLELEKAAASFLLNLDACYGVAAWIYKALPKFRPRKVAFCSAEQNWHPMPCSAKWPPFAPAQPREPAEQARDRCGALLARQQPGRRGRARFWACLVAE